MRWLRKKQYRTTSWGLAAIAVGLLLLTGCGEDASVRGENGGRGADGENADGGIVTVTDATPDGTAPCCEDEVGQAAPGFELPGSDGETYSLEGLKGKTVVVAWFPKAFTSG